MSRRAPFGVSLQLLYPNLFVDYASERLQQRDVRMPIRFGLVVVAALVGAETVGLRLRVRESGAISNTVLGASAT